MKRERKPSQFIRKPIYEGGPGALKEFIRRNLKYPKQAFQKKIEGTVHIRYSIDHQGKVVSSKIIAGIGYGCDEEATRLVSMLRFRVAKNRRIRVLFHKTLHVHFKLPQQVEQRKPAPQPATFQYNFVEKSGPEPPEKGNSYHYQIQL